MNNSEINKKLKTLKKESEDRKHERKVLATDYEKQVDIVKKSGMVAGISFLFHYIVLVSMMNNKKHVTIAGMGRFLSPFVMIVFFGSFIVLLLKGFDLFINSDTKYSKSLAEKLKVNPVAAELKRMNDTITMLDIEIDKLENELYESGEAFLTDDIKDISDIKITASEKVKNRVVERIVLEMPKPEVKSEPAENITDNIKDSKSTEPDIVLNNGKTDKDRNNKNDIEDLFSGLDELSLTEDEDDFESSSEMWEKDAMRRFSRY